MTMWAHKLIGNDELLELFHSMRYPQKFSICTIILVDVGQGYFPNGEKGVYQRNISLESTSDILLVHSINNLNTSQWRIEYMFICGA